MAAQLGLGCTTALMVSSGHRALLCHQMQTPSWPFVKSSPNILISISKCFQSSSLFPTTDPLSMGQNWCPLKAAQVPKARLVTKSPQQGMSQPHSSSQHQKVASQEPKCCYPCQGVWSPHETPKLSPGPIWPHWHSPESHSAC